MIKAYSDGGSRGNPGPSAYAYVIYDDGKMVEEYSCYQGIVTNNMAEHVGLNRLLHRLRFLDIKGAEIFCDSMLVVNQVKGTWKVKHDHLKPVAGESMYLLISGGHTLIHIKGHSGIPGNERADQLCNECLNARET
jgi:ribonuclease HI